jgi:peroxiredoxin family protein
VSSDQPPVAILLISGTHERAHYAFVIAAGAAAVGRPVVVFATNAGCHALMEDWSGLAGSERDATVRARGVAGLEELRTAATELGIRMMVCEAGLRAEAIDPTGLLPSVEVTGVTTFLSTVAGWSVITM